jgi:hypothetical protein
MKDGLIEQLRDMLVVQGVHHPAALALTYDHPEVTQLTQLVRDRGRLHSHRVCEIADGARTLLEPPEDLHAAWCRQNLHSLGDDPRQLCVDCCGLGATVHSVAHMNLC